MPTLVKEHTVTYENFQGADLQRARFAWNQAKRAAALAVSAVQRFDAPVNANLIRRWFGLSPKTHVEHAHKLMQVQSNLMQLNQAFLSRPIILAYRPDIVIKHAPANPAEPVTPVTLSDGTPFTGQNVYGYVHHHKAGSGLRIILGKWFISDPDPQEATQTVYHELSHKVARTKDHVYGVGPCERLAIDNHHKACDNADNYGYFAKSMVTRV